MSTLHRPLPIRASHHLDLLRGLCAVFVLLGHLRGIYPPYAELQAPGILMRAIYFACGYGIEMVIVFFVLSGFFISTSIWRAGANGTWSWSDYLLKRSVRLYLVLIPALVLGALWDRSGIHLFGLEGTEYGRMLQYVEVGSSPALERYSLLTGLGNLFFLQKIVVPDFGANAPLWSLANELWYYLAFPLLLTALTSKERWSRRLLHGALGLAILWGCGLAIARFFPFWLLGAGVGWLWTRGLIYRGRGASVIAALGFGALVTSLALARAHLLGAYHLDLISASCALLVWGLLGAGERAAGRPISPLRSRYARFAAWTAGWSYSLYLLHYPVVAWCRAAIESRGRLWPADVTHFLLGAGLAAAIIAYAAFCAHFTEARTESVRRRIARRLWGARAQTPAAQVT